MEVLLLFIILTACGYFIGKGINSLLFGDNKSIRENDNITIHNHYTNNHLHISKEDLKELSTRKK